MIKYMMVFIFIVINIFLNADVTTDLSNIIPLTEEKISLYNSYKDRIQLISEDLMNCQSVNSQDNPAFQKYFNVVVEYGKFVNENINNNHADTTIHSEKYWKSFFVLTMMDPTVLYTRLFYLMREGLISRAEYLLYFCMIDSNSENKRDRLINRFVSKDISDIKEMSDQIINQGIQYHDAGKYFQAVSEYKKALKIYPKNAQTLYEIVYSIRMKYSDLKVNEVYNNCFDLMRKNDPFYLYGYQGSVNDKIKKTAVNLITNVQPSFSKLMKNKDVIQNLLQFSDGCKEMGEYEYAIYGYKKLLILELSEEKTLNKELLDKIYYCLNQLNIKGIEEFINEFLENVQKKIESSP